MSKYEAVEIRLPRETLDKLNRIAKLAGVSAATVIKVAAATCLAEFEATGRKEG